MEWRKDRPLLDSVAAVPKQRLFMVDERVKVRDGVGC